MVNRVYGEPSSQLFERHNASDFDTLTQDKLSEEDRGKVDPYRRGLDLEGV
jgi:hypothetical protein